MDVAQRFDCEMDVGSRQILKILLDSGTAHDYTVSMSNAEESPR